MQLSSDELIQIKKDFNNIKEKLIKKNNIIKDKIIKSISDYNKLAEFQKNYMKNFKKVLILIYYIMKYYLILFR